MYSICVFLVIFCGIFGAAELLRLLYGAFVRFLTKRGEKKKGGVFNRRT